MATNRSGSLIKSSDEVLNLECCFCAEKNKTREATKYCLNCKDFYCSSCIETHNRFPATKRHKLIDTTDLESLGPDGLIPCLLALRCRQHKSEVINMFCADHNELACSLCSAFNHRTCMNIHNIAEDIDNLYNRTQLNKTKRKIFYTTRTIKEIKSAIENKELREALENEVESVKTFRQQIQTLLDNKEHETISQLNSEFDRITSVLTSDMNMVQCHLDEMEEVNTQLRMSEGNRNQEFVSIKLSEKVIARAENVVKIQQTKTEETFSFSADQNIMSSLQQIRALGKVYSRKHSMTRQEDKLYKVKSKKEINVKLTSDCSVCKLYGSCITDYGTLLLADSNNSNLKRLNIFAEEVQDYIQLQAVPRAVCEVMTQAAVTMDNKCVQFVSLGNTLSTTRTLKLDHTCYGLAYSDGKLFTSDYGKTVFIHDTNGQELMRISTDASGKHIFRGSSYITVSSRGDRLFVSDFTSFRISRRVVILDVEGNYLSTLDYDNIMGPHGLSTDGRYLFIGGYESKNIVQIGKDDRMLGEIAKTKLPLSLCYDHQTNRLIVTCERDNNITMLELE